MSTLQSLESILPPVAPARLSTIPVPMAYVGAVGFEDRSLEFLKRATNEGISISHVIGIQYEPFNALNRVQGFQETVSGLGTGTQLTWLTYNRYNPEEFLPHAQRVLEIAAAHSSLVVDVSGMSKFLIVLLLHCLRSVPVPVELLYAEARTYHPTREIFEKQKQSPIEATPEFLTADVYKIVTATALSSPSMQGHPLLIVAFPTFNYKELLALENELTPQYMVLLQGRPRETHNAWRLHAVRWLNDRVQDYFLDTRIVSTFQYKETLVALEEIYAEYQLTHKLLVSPTGSKLQSFAVFLFKQMHPDVQVVYPVTKEFATEYTEGCNAMWQVSIPSPPHLLATLDKYRKRHLFDLKRAIATRLREARA